MEINPIYKIYNKHYVYIDNLKMLMSMVAIFLLCSIHKTYFKYLIPTLTSNYDKIIIKLSYE